MLKDRPLDADELRDIREWNLKASFDNGGNCPGFAIMDTWPHVEWMRRAALAELDRLQIAYRAFAEGRG